MVRIALNESGIELKSMPKFIGSFELEVEKSLDLSTDQHSEYKWFTTEELLVSEQVHKYVKDYFRK
jgi:colanic acid biosynthesis protein WcaH